LAALVDRSDVANSRTVARGVRQRAEAIFRADGIGATARDVSLRVGTLSEAWLYGDDGKLYAHATTTCIVVEAPRGTLEP
jgi:hypothetical protein